MTSKARPGESEASVPTFDHRLEKLEQIVSELEQGKIGLEAAIERYQEGTALVRQCRALLDGYHKRVEELTESGSKPYEGDPDAPKGREAVKECPPPP